MKFIMRFIFTLLLLILFLPVLTFAQNEKKVAFGILLDNTGTLRTQFGNVQILGKAIAQNTSQRGFISLFNFESRGDTQKPFAFVTTGSEWSQDKDTLEK